MSAKLLSSLGDEGSDLQRQIGCMTGIFQIFDRQHLLSGKRSNLHHHKRHYSGSIPTEPYLCSPPVGQERNSSLVENQRASINSSSSSSCSSSHSSLERNKSMQQEPSINETATNEEIPLKNPSKFQLCHDERQRHIEPSSGTSNATAKGGRQSTDFRDIVKDSIHREAQGLMIRIPASEVPREKHHIELKDSPRPRLLYKSDDHSYLSMTSRKIPMALDLTESPKITSMLREKHRPSSELKEHLRSPSAFPNDNLLFPLLRDVPRISYDERDIPRVSLDSRESGCSTSRLRDLSRFSLDGRESSMNNSEAVFNTGHSLQDTDRTTSQQKVSKTMAFGKMGSEEKQPPNVVAKLMGLETMPDKIYNSPGQIGIRNSNFCEGADVCEARNVGNCSFDSSKAGSPKSSIKVNIIPQRTISHLKVPIETAPWSQQAKGRVPPKRMLGRLEAHVKRQHESVYGEIQKKLKDLEFQPANKDLRALKRILDAIHAKGLLEVKKGEEEHSKLATKKIRGQQTSFDLECLSTSGEGKCTNPSKTTNASSMKTWESPIVIMKPAKSLNRSEGVHSSIDSLEGVTELCTIDAADSQHISSMDKTEEEKMPMGLHRGNGGHVQVTEKKSVERINARFSQKVGSRTANVLSRQEKKSIASGVGSTVSCNSSSPRPRQKKLGLEKKSCYSPSPDSSKQQKPLGQSLESVSPRSKLKPKLRPEKKVSDDSCRGRNSRSQGIRVSQRLNGNGCYTSQVEMEPTGSNHSAKQESTSSCDDHEATGEVDNLATSIVRKKNNYQTRDRCFSSDGVASTSDQPSPVSVLDAPQYKDEVSGSPVRSTLFPLKGRGNQNAEDIAGDRRWNLPDDKGPQTNTIVRKKLKSIENLVHKLEQLGSSDNQDSETNHISFLWETQNPEHHYVSEILLASGLMLNDLDTSFPQIRLHQSGYPINPNLFLVLEQKRTRSLATLDPSCQNASMSKFDPERAQRRLTFDMVNEILAWKLPGDQLPASYLSACNLSRRVPSGQLLLKELCEEIECLENDGAPSPYISSRQDEEGWTSSGREVSELVLKIERLIFKDLIGELVNWEPMMAQRKLYPRRRLMFA